MGELTAEEIVKQKYPDAYCNNWKSSKGLRWWICTGVYQDQRSLGPKRLTSEMAWADAAKRLTESKEQEK